MISPFVKFLIQAHAWWRGAGGYKLSFNFGDQFECIMAEAPNESGSSGSKSWFAGTMQRVGKFGIPESPEIGKFDASIGQVVPKQFQAIAELIALRLGQQTFRNRMAEERRN